MTSTEFNSLIKEITQEMNFKRIYDEYYPYIVKYTGYLYRGKNIENDVAQDIFTYILTHENMPYVENPKGWIRTLCKNVGLKLINNDLPLQDGYDYKQDIKTNEFNELLSVLSKGERYIIEQKYRYRFTLKEIAQKTERSYTAVLKEHNRILKKLKKLLSKNIK